MTGYKVKMGAAVAFVAWFDRAPGHEGKKGVGRWRHYIVSSQQDDSPPAAFEIGRQEEAGSVIMIYPSQIEDWLQSQGWGQQEVVLVLDAIKVQHKSPHEEYDTKEEFYYLLGRDGADALKGAGVDVPPPPPEWWWSVVAKIPPNLAERFARLPRLDYMDEELWLNVARALRQELLELLAKS
ncbi:MAG: hypothetical protein ACOX0G_01735 [Patescibacteria group bacterium]|jgi:hypothetical protein